jgi:transcription elongation GreA/GreB family factor
MAEEPAPQEARRILYRRRQRLKDRIRDYERAVAQSKTDASDLTALGAARAELAEVVEALRRMDRDEHDPILVEIGDTVTLREEGSSKAERYTLVGPVEARVDESWISADSPLGSALLGRRAGDTATVEAPGGTVLYRVLSIDYP